MKQFGRKVILPIALTALIYTSADAGVKDFFKKTGSILSWPVRKAYGAMKNAGDGSESTEPGDFLAEKKDYTRIENDGVSAKVSYDGPTATQNFSNPSETKTTDNSNTSVRAQGAIGNWVGEGFINSRKKDDKLEGKVWSWDDRDWVDHTQESQTKDFEFGAGAGYRNDVEIKEMPIEYAIMLAVASTERAHTQNDRPGIEYNSDGTQAGIRGNLAASFGKTRTGLDYARLFGGGDYQAEFGISAEREAFGGTKALLRYSHLTRDEQEAARSVIKKDILRMLLRYDGSKLKGLNIEMGGDIELGGLDGMFNNYDMGVGVSKEIKGNIFEAKVSRHRDKDDNQRYSVENTHGYRFDFGITHQIDKQALRK